MPSAAPVLDIYKSLIGNANPIEAYSRGVELRAKLDAIAAKQQADSFQMTLDTVKLAQERSESEQKMKLANRELDISSMNAETNRMNAMRGLKSAGGRAAAPAPATPNLIDHGDGSFSVDFSGQAGNTQVPTEGEGDGKEPVAPLQTGEAQSPSLLPSGGTAPAPPSQMALPIMPGQAPRSAPTTTAAPAPSAPTGAPTAGAAPPHKGLYGPPAYSITPRGTTVTMKPLEQPKPAQPPMSSEQFDQMEKLAKAQGLKLTKINADENGLPKFSWDRVPESDAPKLSPEQEKTMIPMFAEIVSAATAARQARATPEQKMPLVNVTNSADMTPELWDDADAIAKEQGIVDPVPMRALEEKVHQYVDTLNGYRRMNGSAILQTRAGVMADLGFNTKKTEPASTAAPNASAAPQGNSAPAASKADLASNGDQVAALKAEIVALPAGSPERKQKEAFLASIKAGAQSKGATQPGMASAQERLAAAGAKSTAILKQAQEAPNQADEAKKLAENEKWIGAKVDLAEAIVASGKSLESLDFIRPEVQPFKNQRSTYFFDEWLREHGEKSGLKAMDGKRLTADSPMFVNNDGRTIKLKELFRATLDDPAITGAAATGEAKSGLSQRGRDLYKKAVSN